MELKYDVYINDDHGGDSWELEESRDFTVTEVYQAMTDDEKIEMLKLLINELKNGD